MQVNQVRQVQSNRQNQQSSPAFKGVIKPNSKFYKDLINAGHKEIKTHKGLYLPGLVERKVKKLVGKSDSDTKKAMVLIQKVAIKLEEKGVNKPKNFFQKIFYPLKAQAALREKSTASMTQ